MVLAYHDVASDKDPGYSKVPQLQAEVDVSRTSAYGDFEEALPHWRNTNADMLRNRTIKLLLITSARFPQKPLLLDLDVARQIKFINI